MSKSELAHTLYHRAQDHLARMEYEEAQAPLIQSINEMKTPAATFDLGEIHFLRGRMNNAVLMYEAALKLDPKLHVAYARLGEIFAADGQIPVALDRYAFAIRAKPDELAYKERFIALVRNLTVQGFDLNFKALLLNCLTTPGLDVTVIAPQWYAILRNDPSFKTVIKAVRKGSYEAFQEALADRKTRAALADPYLSAGLRTLIVPEMECETLVTFLRRYLLETMEEGAAELACALSFYALSTEYIFGESGEERSAVDAIRARVAAGDATPVAIFMLACYEPLHRLPHAAQLEAALRDDPVATGADFIRLHLEDFAARERLKSDIPVVSKIENAVSGAVQAQYEEFPYPQWTTLHKEMLSPDIEGRLLGAKSKILIAGCGTGREALELAYSFPDADVLAIDLSRTSLSYGMLRAKQLGITNIEFAQADIVSLDLPAGSFDFIASSGVLHHTEDPEKSWSVLVKILKPGGLMRIALYSEIARRAIVEARAVIEEKHYANNAADIRRFRGDAEDLLSPGAYREIATLYDYYNMPECRDLLFHVHEHRYTLIELAAMMERLHLQFLRFYLPPAVLQLYNKANKDDPGAVDLAKWHCFEEQHPTTFRGMFRFWCQKPAV